MTHMKQSTLAYAALLMGAVLSGPSRGMFGPSAPLFKDGDGVDAVMQELKGIEDRLSAKLDKRLEDIKSGQNVPYVDKDIKRLEAEHAQLKADLQGLEAKANRLDLTGGLRSGEVKSAGQQFVEGVELKGRGSRFSIGMELKALTTGNIGNAPEAVRLPLQEAPTEPHIRDLIPSGETSAASLKFPQRKESATVNGAAMVAEGERKPESSFAFEMVTFEVKKVAHWLKASDELLDDQPGLRSYEPVRKVIS